MEHKGICAVCGAEFSRNRPLRGTTCGQKCRGATRAKEPEKRECRNCGSPFFAMPGSKVTHCSIACFNRRGRRKADMVRTCVHCANEYTRSAGQTKRRFCSRECAIEHNRGRGRIGTQYDLPIFTQRNKRPPKQRLDMKEHFRACQRCGWNEEPAILHRHHKNRDRKNNAMSNIEVLCPTCHVLEHYRSGDSIWNPIHQRGRKRHA
jgi:hypothetical protein